MILVTATLDNVTLPIEGNGQQLISGSITQEVGVVPSFSFEIDPTNAGFDLIQSRKTLIKCVNDRTGRVEFHGRVLLSEQKMSSSGAISKTVVCEGFLGYLHDSVQPYKEEALYSVDAYIEMVLANHNAQVEPSKRINLLWTDVAGNGGLIYKGLQYQSTFETLKTKLVDVFGGEFVVEEIDGGLWLIYAQQLGETRATPIELGVNMQDASREVSPLDIVTRIIPLGAKLKIETTDADGNVTETESGERLTLVGHTLDDGTVMDVPWIDDDEKIKTLGIIVGTIDCPDISEQYNLYTRAREWLVYENRVNLAHTLTAIDLKELGHELDGIYCGDSYPVRNNLIGLDETLRVNKKIIDIKTPYKSNITIADKKATLSKLQKEESDRVEVQMQEMKEKVEQFGQTAGSLSSQVSNFSTEMYKTAREVVTAATANYVTTEGLNKATEDLRAELVVKADGIEMKFDNEIVRVEGETAEKLSTLLTELHAYIRYYKTDKGEPTIELGTESSDLICYLTNGRLDFKLNGNSVAYITTDENGVSQLFITNATILQRLNLGAFTFKMRDNNNLSMIKTREVL